MIYMADYFSILIHDVDMECEIFLAEQVDRESKASIQVWDDHSAIVKAIKSEL